MFKLYTGLSLVIVRTPPAVACGLRSYSRAANGKRCASVQLYVRPPKIDMRQTYSPQGEVAS